MAEGPRVFEVLVPGYDGLDEVLALRETVALLLCPDPLHAGPCEVPWSLGLRAEEEGDAPVGTGHTVVVGLLTTRAGAEETAARIGAGLGRAARLVEADPGDHEDLVEQHRAERGR
ncbi:hypothetical protein CQJ94_21805 [Glycomyces fuscus]|nr:hypothetical protein CQJ94_21805 [Glycomyces fuscus]